MLALLGWNPGTEQEIFSMQELVDTFSLDRVSKAGARFQPDKAKWFNAQYVHNLTAEQFAPIMQPILKEHGVETSDELAGKAAEIMKERVTLTTELWDLTSFFFVAPEDYDEKLVKKQWKGDNVAMLKALKELLATIEDFSKENTESVVRAWIEANGYSLGQVMNTLRLALVGAGKGPGMFDVTEFLGREECIKRIDNLFANVAPQL
jgi:glutamyl-tRNA synthetase